MGLMKSGHSEPFQQRRLGGGELVLGQDSFPVDVRQLPETLGERSLVLRVCGSGCTSGEPPAETPRSLRADVSLDD